MWYRGRLESFDLATNKVKVDFVDFGNSDEVRLDQVRLVLIYFFNVRNGIHR